MPRGRRTVGGALVVLEWAHLLWGHHHLAIHAVWVVHPHQVIQEGWPVLLQVTLATEVAVAILEETHAPTHAPIHAPIHAPTHGTPAVVDMRKTNRTKREAVGHSRCTCCAPLLPSKNPFGSCHKLATNLQSNLLPILFVFFPLKCALKIQ